MMKSPKTAIIPPKWIVENAKNFSRHKLQKIVPEPMDSLLGHPRSLAKNFGIAEEEPLICKFVRRVSSLI